MNSSLKLSNRTPVHVLRFGRRRQVIGVEFEVRSVPTTDDAFHKGAPETAESWQVTLVGTEFEAITGLDEINYNAFPMATTQANSILLICCCFLGFY
jgi:hypothetical protein